LLGALQAGAVAVSRRSGARRLLEDCWTPVRNAVELRFADILLETLGPLARSEDEDEARPAKQILLRDKAALQAFSEALHAEFKQAVGAFCTHQAQGKANGATGLSLVAYDDMEFSTLMERASARIRNATDSEFNALKVRLANMVREPEVRDIENPFRPVIFLRAIYLGLERVGITEPDLLRMTKRFDSALVEPIAAAYAAVDRHLEAQGISADVAPATLNRNSGHSGNSGNSGNSTSGVPATPFTNSVMRGLYQDSRNTAGPVSLSPALTIPGVLPESGVPVDQLLHALYQRMHLVAAPLRQGGGQVLPSLDVPLAGLAQSSAIAGAYLAPIDAPQPRRAVGVGGLGSQAAVVDPELLAAIAEAQRAGAATTVVHGAAAVGTVIDPSLLRAQVSDKAARQVDKLTIEIVGMLFERIAQDRLVPAPIKEQLQRLQFPLIRVALTDPELFVSPQQPARELLDRMAATALGWVPQGEQNQRYLEEVKRAVATVLESTDEGIAPFKQALDLFEKYLTEVNTRDDDPVARAKRALEEAETREVLAINATIQIRQAFEGVMLESYLRDFLLETWVRVLVAANLREATQPGLMRHYLKLVPALVWTVQPKVNPDDKQHLARKVPPVLNALREGLALIDWPQAKAQEFFAKLLNSHAQAVKALELAHGATGEFSSSTMRIKLDGLVLDAETLPEEVANNELPVSDDAVEQLLAANKIDIEHVPAPQQTEPQQDKDAELERHLAEFRRGDWFDLSTGTTVDRVQLRWLSPRRAIYLFATAHDDKIFSMKPATLRALMREGRVVPVEDEQMFDRALRATKTTLEQVARDAVAASA
jgi:hypothetical protein